jgi:hypothetical protein
MRAGGGFGRLAIRQRVGAVQGTIRKKADTGFPKKIRPNIYIWATLKQFDKRAAGP